MLDSGIDPDSLSTTSSMAEYLNQIDVSYSQVNDKRHDSCCSRSLKYPSVSSSDSDINDLIYAKVDEILSPSSEVDLDYSTVASGIPRVFNASPFTDDFVPSFTPLRIMFSEVERNRGRERFGEIPIRNVEI
ncbi:hypothetical protein AB6A40_004780 [Gnathostoma spinigerum]|uniref:Uncharacterized protein n=1 Tax=Gnathostoma spinigerum TaxID=75299 RepID=A0ABD6EKY3_9BILA